MSNAWGRKVLVLAFTAVSVIAAAQDNKQSEPTVAKDRGSVGGTTERREAVKGRLPRYFASLVNSEQRIEIYLIQAKFRDQISELKQQLEKLEFKQMQDIEAVLTTEQHEKLLDFRNSSRKKRSKEPTTDEPRISTQSKLDSEDQNSRVPNN